MLLLKHILISFVQTSVNHPVALIGKEPMACFDSIVFQRKESHWFLSVERSQVSLCSHHSSCTSLSPRWVSYHVLKKKMVTSVIGVLYISSSSTLAGPENRASFSSFYVLNARLFCFPSNHRVTFTFPCPLVTASPSFLNKQTILFRSKVIHSATVARRPSVFSHSEMKYPFCNHKLLISFGVFESDEVNFWPWQDYFLKHPNKSKT